MDADTHPYPTSIDAREQAQMAISAARRQAGWEFSPFDEAACSLRELVAMRDAARAWLQRLEVCPYCNGKGWRLEPLPARWTPGSMRVGADGETYIRHSVIVGDTLYEGWRQMEPDDLIPETREVLCEHPGQSDCETERNASPFASELAPCRLTGNPWRLHPQ